MLALLVTACLAGPLRSPSASERAPTEPALTAEPARVLPAGEEREELLPDGRTARFEVRSGRDGELVRHGTYREHFAGGALACEGRYKDGRRIGRWTHNWANGEKRADGPYRAEARHGKWRHYRPDGTLESEGAYRHGEREGTWTWFAADGTELVSGELGRHRVTDAHGRTWEGATVAGRKAGLWTCTRPSGVPLVVGEYANGVMQGDWAVLAPDGVLVEPWSGTWRDGRREGPLASTAALAARLSDGELVLRGLPEAGAARNAVDAVDVPEPWGATIERWLAASEPERSELRAEIVASRRAAWPAIVAVLAACDLADEAGAARARAIHAELLAHLAGTAWPWSEGTGAEAVAANRDVVRRWTVFGELTADVHVVWDYHLDPVWHLRPFELAETILSEPPMPAAARSPGPPAAGPTPRPPMEEPPVDVGSTDWGPAAVLVRLGGAFGTIAAMRNALDRIRVEQAPDGSVDGSIGATAFCALALLAKRVDPLDSYDGRAALRALRWIAAQPVGSIAEELLVTEAFVDAGRRTSLAGVRAEARHRVGQLLMQRAPDGGVPRESGGAGHPGATARAALVLALGEHVGFEVESERLRELLAWLAARTASDGSMRGGDPDPWLPSSPEAVTAATCLARAFLGDFPAKGLGPGDPQMIWLLARAPTAKAKDPVGDPWFTLYGSHAAYWMERVSANEWSEALEPHFRDTQSAGGTWPALRRSPAVNAAFGVLIVLHFWRYEHLDRG